MLDDVSVTVRSNPGLGRFVTGEHRQVKAIKNQKNHKKPKKPTPKLLIK